MNEQLDELERHLDELERLEGVGRLFADCARYGAGEEPPAVQQSAVRILRVRRGRVEDLPALVGMAIRFIAETQYRAVIVPNVERLAVLTGYLLEHGAVFVAQADGPNDLVGMLGVSLLPHVMSGELVATEAAWWVNPERRGGMTAVRMLAAAERWAREAGAVWMQMIAPRGEERLREFYRRRGYLELETLFQLRLSLHVRFEGVE